METTVQQDKNPAGEEGAARRERPKDLGNRGEDAACAFLRRNGFEILEKNWTCAVGEVDIIARDDGSLHFVEVKTRRGTGCGFPAEAVTPKKRHRYEVMAELYLREYEDTDIYVSFDVVSIVVTGPGRAFLKAHFNAFAGE